MVVVLFLLLHTPRMKVSLIFVTHDDLVRVEIIELSPHGRAA